MHECFADEIAIDFPSVDLVVDRMRDAFLGERADADVVLRPRCRCRAKTRGAASSMPVDVPIRGTCDRCGGRGETWTEPCEHCAGHRRIAHPVPGPALGAARGVADGARIRFRVVVSARRRRCASKCGSPSDPRPELSSHVDLVGVLFIIWGILTALIGVSTLALAVAGASIMASANHGGGGQVAAGVTSRRLRRSA